MNLYTLRLSILFIAIFLHALISNADVTPAKIFTSNMVLQEGQQNPIWGRADKGERITIQFNENTIRTQTDRQGKWKAYLPAMNYGGPYKMVIQGKNKIIYDNIMIGEVWLCSGQSNMEFKVQDAINGEMEVAKSYHPNIRLFYISKELSQTPVDDLDKGEWTICTPENIATFTAVGYFFGRALHENLNVPIGLIESAWGGTIAETWTSGKTIQNDPDLSNELKKLLAININEYKRELLDQITLELGYLPLKDSGLIDGKAIYADPDMDDSDWDEIECTTLWEDSGYKLIDGIAWYRKTFQLTKEEASSPGTAHVGIIDDADITWINGVKIGSTHQYNKHREYNIPGGILKEGRNEIAIRVWDTGGGGGLQGYPEDFRLDLKDNQISLAGKWKFKVTEISQKTLELQPNNYPTLLYNSMINPIVPYGIKGAIWYQGESNESRAKQYRRIFPNLIKDWRMQWNQGDFPFLFVSLANFRAPVDEPGESMWAELREAQTMTLALPNTGMAMAIDIGDANDIHPKNKQDVGKRLEMEALRIAYGKDIVSSGPMFESMKIDGDRIIIKFKDTGEGLVVKDRYGYVKGFTIAGVDGHFVWAKSKTISDNSVVVYSEKVKNPIAVRYGWADNPDDVNLYNKEGFPAVPFRTDDWPGITK